MTVLETVGMIYVVFMTTLATIGVGWLAWQGIRDLKQENEVKQLWRDLRYERKP